MKKKNKGIQVNNTDFKLVQFADDITVILDGSKASLSETLDEMENFEKKIFGLKVNFQKIQVIWIGKKKYSHDLMKTKMETSVGT